MKIFFRVAFVLIIAFLSARANAASITFDQNNATVWLYMQSIAGKVNGNVTGLKLYCNGTAYAVNINADNTFKVMVKLGNGNNKIWATGIQGSAVINSARLMLKLGYRILPDIKPFASIVNGKAELKTQLISNPEGSTLKYLWAASPNNPAACLIANKNGKTSTVTIPGVDGTYYFNLLVTSGTDSVKLQTYITRAGTELHAYLIEKDHAAWIDTAIIYEINPSVFVKEGTYDAITAKLAEIRSTGVNTIWLQPVCKTSDYHGQGYSVTDFFAMRTDLGTEQQLDKFIATAKKLHFKIIFDFVPNHISVQHPYVQAVLKKGDSTHYYNFLQHKKDGKPYSSDYVISSSGLVSYFWKNLINLDYNNPEVQQWIIEATKYWMLKYDLDGYRFDSMWGVNARNRGFSKKLNIELKSIKPDLLLLAEEKSCDKIVYDNGFDAAYDWTSDTTFVSQWIFQTHYNANKSLTVFDESNGSRRANLVHNAIFKNSSLTNRSLRFIENNDVPRFIANHSLQQTKMVAGLEFALPGIPMLYNGQEIGCANNPYAYRTIFNSGQTIAQSDTTGLYLYYKRLIKERRQYQQLSSAFINEVGLTNSPNMTAFHRWKGNQHMIILINLANAPGQATLVNDANLKQYIPGAADLSDVLTSNDYHIDPSDASTMQIPMQGYGIRYLVLKPKM